jgi:serine/threonine protein kinase/tetratricopeptide (TPR) repeat protein
MIPYFVLLRIHRSECCLKIVATLTEITMLHDRLSHIVGKRYLLGRQLGHGGMGAVYEATDRLSGEHVALKRVMVPTTRLSVTKYSDLMDADLALAQEFRVMASLRHPNINSVLDYGFDDARKPYFTMELLSNAHGLYEVAKSKSDPERVHILIEILQALSYLHRFGIIHRDLKSGNILLIHGQQVKVLDFGLSVTRQQIEDKNDPTVRAIAGTAGYIAPEVIAGSVPTAQSDLYAVGVMGYRMFADKPLFDSEDTDQLLLDTYNLLPDMSPIQNTAVALVLNQLLSKYPLDRYRSAEETIAALCRAVEEPVPGESIAIRESFLQAARFVGRESELQLLMEVLDKARDSKGEIALISGESGVGKSRLLDELRTQALVKGVLVLRGDNAKEGGSPYQMWRPALRWLALLTPLEDNEASILKSLVPDLESLLNHKIADAPDVSPVFAQERLMVVIEKLLSQHEQPVLLILEDLQWAGSESLSVLRRVSEIVQTLPLMVIASYRSDEAPQLPTLLPNIPSLKLTKLAEDEIAELSVAILGERGRQPQLLELLKRETEGNVFFVVEIVRALAESAGKLDGVGEVVPEHVLTGGVMQIIQRRLDSIPLQYRPLLEIAAVAGRQLDLKILRQFTDNTTLEEAITLCANTAVLEIKDGTWRFAHDQLRDGMLTHIPDDKRKDLHRDIATAIETVYLYAPEHIPAVAYHWRMAGDKAKEGHYAALAGKQALQTGAYEEAVKFLEQALTLLPSLTEASSERPRGLIYQQLGEAYQALSEYSQARAMFERSLLCYEVSRYRWGIASAHKDLGYVIFLEGNQPEARDHFYSALKTAMDNRALVLALASLLGIANLLAQQGKEEQAVELLTLIINNPAADWQTMARAREFLDQLIYPMEPDVVERATQRGQTSKLSEVANRLLAV